MDQNRIKKNFGDIIYTDGRYTLTYDITNASPKLHQIFLFFDGEQVGILNTKEVKYQGQIYVEVNGINIEPKHRSKGFGKMMYRTLIDHSPTNVKGLISNLNKQLNKKEIPSIYKKLGSIQDNGYAIIEFS